MKTTKWHCGYVAIIGHSNVGKSTLLNAILGTKLCITSPKLQTTRHSIIGIKTKGYLQTIYVDTPGMHLGGKRLLNKVLNRSAQKVLYDVDVVVFVIDIGIWRHDDQFIIEKLQGLSCPIIVAINKVDLLKDKKKLLPTIKSLTQKMNFHAIIPISARHSTNLCPLEAAINALLPLRRHLFSAQTLTNRTDHFMIAETIREQIIHLTAQEVPHATAVSVEQVKKENNMLYIMATIWVERLGQKAIMIGQKGDKIKAIGHRARLLLEKRYQTKVCLKLWVKVKPTWSNDSSALQHLAIIN